MGNGRRAVVVGSGTGPTCNARVAIWFVSKDIILLWFIFVRGRFKIPTCRQAPHPVGLMINTPPKWP